MTNVDPADLDEQIEIAAGRRAPFSQLGDWVALSDLHPTAKTLYWVLKMHVNQQRGDSQAWPARITLADVLGFSGKKRDESVDRYIRALAALGAIEVTRARNGMRRRNIYTVHDTPPDEYAGPRSLEEWYRARRDESAGQPVPGRSGGSESAGQAVPGFDGGRYPAAAGVANPPTTGVGTPLEPGYVPGKNRVELDEVELDEDLSIDARERADDGSSDGSTTSKPPDSLEPTGAARDLVGRLDYGAHSRPSARQVGEIAALVDAALAGGLSLPEIRRHAQAKIRQAKTNPVAYLMGGLAPDQLPVPTPTPDAARRNPVPPPRKPRSAEAEAAVKAFRDRKKPTVTTRTAGAST